METLTPAYGRDYKTAKAVKADWDADKDFIVTNLFSQWDGKPINKTDAKNALLPSVKIRFNRLAKLTIIKI